MSAPTLPRSIAAFGNDDFRDTLRRELESLDPSQLPLQQGLQHSSHVSARPFSVLVHSIEEHEHSLQARVEVLFTGIVAGCNCSDDPSRSEEEVNEQCMLMVDIDRDTGAATIRGSGPDSHL